MRNQVQPTGDVRNVRRRNSPKMLVIRALQACTLYIPSLMLFLSTRQAFDGLLGSLWTIVFLSYSYTRLHSVFYDWWTTQFQIGDDARVLGMHEAHGQEHQIRRQLELAARDALEAAALEFDAHAVKLLDLAVATDALGGHAPVAFSAFFVRRRGAELKRPQRPGRGRRAFLGRTRHDLEARHAERALAM